MRQNRWETSIRDDIRNHPLFASMRTKLADNSFHRDQMLEVTGLVPESWVRDVAVVGDISECVTKLQEFKDAGCHEIDFYSSSPAQNTSLIKAWAERKAAA